MVEKYALAPREQNLPPQNILSQIYLSIKNNSMLSEVWEIIELFDQWFFRIVCRGVYSRLSRVETSRIVMKRRENWRVKWKISFKGNKTFLGTVILDSHWFVRAYARKYTISVFLKIWKIKKNAILGGIFRMLILKFFLTLF